jgi:hypothetical protein
MSTVPTTQVGQIEFYEGHTVIWTGIPEQIGVQPATLTALTAKTTSARTAYTDLLAKRSAYHAAVEELQYRLGLMNAEGSGVIATIRSYAKSSGDGQVYSLAQIPAPKTPSPIPAPGMAYAPAAQLRAGGGLNLSWRCANPPEAVNTTYEIHRQDDSGATVHLGTTGDKKFTDLTLPAGTALATYTITAVRGKMRGQPSDFTVRFGTPAPAVGTSATGTTVTVLRPAA